jgi:hypothetical protein
MANNWNILLCIELEVKERDKRCVYCGTEFTSTKISKKNISKDTVAPIIKKVIKI